MTMMNTLDVRETVTGRREQSDSRLPLTVQNKERAAAAIALADSASRAFTATLKKEMAKVQVVKK
jgi:hypothetical protein